MAILASMINKSQLTVGARVTVNINRVPTPATYVSWSEKYGMPIVEVNGRQRPRRVLSLGEAVATVATATATTTPSEEIAAPEIAVTETPVAINVRFEYLEMLVGMVATATPTSCIIVGSGGLGKSYTVFDKLRNEGLEEDQDYVVIRGYATPKSMYRAMYENRDKILVFDDCDSVLSNDTAINLLKAALESTETRRVSWLTERGGDSADGLPPSFNFIGKVIFISNRQLNQVPQPLLSRSLYVDVTMTPGEKIERMRKIAPKIRPEVPMDEKLEVISMLDDLKARTKDLNIRTLLKCLDIRKSAPADQWKAVAEYIVTTGIGE